MAGKSTAKDLVVLIIDVGPMMDIAPPMGGDSPLESSITVASQLVTQKLFSGAAKSEVGIVLFGTNDTDNPLASDDGGYDNISIVQPMATPDIDMLRFIKENIQIGDNNPADFIDALVVGMDLIARTSQEIAKVGDKKIYMFTSCGSHYSDDGLDRIVGQLKERNIQLIIIGPHIQDDDDNDDTRPRGDDGPSSRPPGGSGDSSGLKKTAQQLAGERVLTRVLSATEGVSFTYQEALNIANVFKRTSKKQTTRFSGELTIGSCMKIPCKVFTKTMLEKPSTWKKLSAISQSSVNPGNMAVKLDRSYHLQDEDETEVDSDEAVKGYRYGKSLIPVSAEDEEAMKLSTERCMAVLGFTAMKNIKPHHIIGSSVQVVVPNPDDECAMTALSSIIHALYEMNMAGIVRYAFRKNSNPKLCALVPHIKPDSECLHMYQLPFTEDLRQFPFSSLMDNPKLTPSDEQLQVVDDLIEDMDLMKAERDEDGDPVEAVKTKNISHIVIQRTYQCIQNRALNKDDPLPEIDPFLSRSLEPPTLVQTKCSARLQQMKEKFPLVVVEKKQASNPSEVWSKKSNIDLDADEPSSKKAKTDDDTNEDTDFSMASLARGTIEEVGTVDPIGDYDKLMSNQDIDTYRKVCTQLQLVSLRLVKESFGDAMYDKALTCIRKLREEAIKYAKPKAFNEFLKNAKEDLLGTRYSPFWDSIKEANISLISNDECPSSDISPDDSKSFISDEVPNVSMEEEKEPEEDEAEDLLAMMD